MAGLQDDFVEVAAGGRPIRGIEDRARQGRELETVAAGPDFVEGFAEGKEVGAGVAGPAGRARRDPSRVRGSLAAGAAAL